MKFSAKKFSALVLLFALALNLVSCFTAPETPDPDRSDDGGVEELQYAVDLMKDITANTVEASENYTEKNGALTDFALRLFGQSLKDGENTLVSPVSVAYALAMTANGAEGETRQQMEGVLGMSTEELNLYLYSYMDSLPEKGSAKLHIANSIWFTDDESFVADPAFLQTNADYYGADIYKLPFNDEACRDINRWVKNNTNGMIPKILDSIPELAVMYLVNALAFEADWAEPYQEHQVKQGVFRTEDGSEQSAEFMYGSEDFYFADDNAKGFMKYYKGGKYSFVALLPNEGMSISEYVATLDGDSLSAMLSQRNYAIVNTAIPKFSSEYDTEMSELLIGMGMSLPFDRDRASFEGIGVSAIGNIYISRVIHKTFIEVGEMGTRAGAATLVEMSGNGSMPPEQIVDIYLDRPFVYMLIDTENNIPLFIGALTETGE